MFGRLILFIFVKGASLYEGIKIDLMRVKIRSVNTGELRLSADYNAAAAAHAGTVYHDRVKRYNGLYPVRSGDISEEFHHDIRPDGDHSVELCFAGGNIGFNLLLEEYRRETFLAIGSVIRAHDKLI